MTPDARARLVEVMTRAAYEHEYAAAPRWLWETAGERRKALWRSDMEAAIAAAERAGFKWEESTP